MIYKITLPQLVDNKKKYNASDIEIDHVGYFIGTTLSYRYDGLDANDLKEFGLVLEDKKTINLQDKTVYRFPKLNLPRQKLELLKEKYNCKVIRNKEKAEILIVSPKYVNSLVKTNYHRSRDLNQYFKLLTSLKQSDLLSECAVNKFNDFFQDPEKFIPGSRIDVCFSYAGYHSTKGVIEAKREDIVHKWKEDINKNLLPSANDLRDVVIESESDFEQWLFLQDNSRTIILDEDVMNLTNEGLAIIPNDEYNTIHSMLTSTDQETRSLCVEMIANCNVNESFDVVATLFYWHYDWFKNSNNWNTVNVKALRQALKEFGGVNHENHSIYQYNQFISKMINRGKLTKFVFENTRKRLYTKLINQMVGPGSEMWTVKEIDLTLRPEEFNKIKFNETE
jgi:hypothetical protein|tara:strand:- start:8241 stop:9422 length:1182 start_codon:yes stop_codon:yes gene_type:complete